MNSLSWFIYLAEIVPNLAAALGVIGITILAAWGFYHFFTFTEDHPLAHILRGDFSLKYPIIAAIFLLISSLMPSTEVIYLIAGSEAGEMVVTSDQGKEILNDVSEVIKRQLNELKKPEE